MKTLFFCLMATFVIFAGCSKDETCTGTIDIVNISDDAYEVYLDGKFHKRLWEQMSHVTVEKGHHTVRTKQITGYILYPTENFFEFDINCGEYKNINFP
jgi:hypothetical protein